MVYLNVKTLKHLDLRTAVTAAICGSLLATLCLAVAQSSNPGTGDAGSGQKKVALIIHARNQGGNPVAPNSVSVKDVLVMEHGRKLQVVDGPKSAGPKQVAFWLDSNLHQRKALALEQQTAVELLAEFEKEKAQALVKSYGAEIHSSEELTDEWATLKQLTGSLLVETDKQNETILLFDAMNRALKKWEMDQAQKLSLFSRKETTTEAPLGGRV
jgi:hypothetical protein